MKLIFVKKTSLKLITEGALFILRCIARIPRKSCRIFGLQYIAQKSLDKGKFKKAKKEANELLTLAAEFQNDFQGGNAIHHANIILGRIYLKEGNIAQAKKCLIQAGQTPGSPQLNSFGPVMILAKELLEKEETQVVLDYFQLCSIFWKSQKLKIWTKQVKEGRIPEFRGNLLY